jgi:hypothetical protein
MRIWIRNFVTGKGWNRTLTERKCSYFSTSKLILLYLARMVTCIIKWTCLLLIRISVLLLMRISVFFLIRISVLLQSAFLLFS